MYLVIAERLVGLRVCDETASKIMVSNVGCSPGFLVEALGFGLEDFFAGARGIFFFFSFFF